VINYLIGLGHDGLTRERNFEDRKTGRHGQQDRGKLH
jgi:hypothetical protein